MRSLTVLVVATLLCGLTLQVHAATQLVPLGGNAYVTRTSPTGDEVINDTGLHNWNSKDAVVSVYFHVQQPGYLQLALTGALNGATRSQVRVSVDHSARQVELRAGASSFPAGGFYIKKPGYVKVDLQGIRSDGGYFGDISGLQIDGIAATGATFANDPDNFYWSRRGPSVHLGFTAPPQTRYFYSEVTVPRGQDPLGTYYMANGFNVGYFGIQTVSATERWVLFSVWDSPDGPTRLVRKGPDVITNGFGGEGTGGQSHLTYNWEAGKTYCFLTGSQRDSDGNVSYSAWFAPKRSGNHGNRPKTTCDWRLIATWKYVGGDGDQHGLYSFLEGFYPTTGYLGRRASYGNQWAVSRTGLWTELTSARFTVDATGANRQRLDYAGGVDRNKGTFYLRNDGFFSPTVAANQTFSRRPARKRPDIDLPPVE